MVYLYGLSLRGIRGKELPTPTLDFLRKDIWQLRGLAGLENLLIHVHRPDIYHSELGKSLKNIVCITAAR